MMGASFARSPTAAMRLDLLAGTRHLARPPSLPVRRPTILVFDSGLGGLTVFDHVTRLCGGADLVYAADDAAFPYGALSEPALVRRVLDVMHVLLTLHAPDLVVIACNTASTLVLPHLRARYPLPFVGTVPAIKPAAEGTRSGLISVLATPGTVRRDYTHELVDTYAGRCRVNLVGAVRLAGFAEAEMAGEPVPDEVLRREIAPCFVEDGAARTDTVVLACTHYPLLLRRFQALAPWPVTWIDPSPAIARRVADLLGPLGAGREISEVTAVFTSGISLTPALRSALCLRGVGEIVLNPLPLCLDRIACAA